MLACLRFADAVTDIVARLATVVGELTLRRTGFAPAGRLTKFHGLIASSIPLRPAGPGRTMRAIPLMSAVEVIGDVRSRREWDQRGADRVQNLVAFFFLSAA